MPFDLSSVASQDAIDQQITSCPIELRSGTCAVCFWGLPRLLL